MSNSQRCALCNSRTSNPSGVCPSHTVQSCREGIGELRAENARLRAALVAILAELRTTNTSTESIVKDIAKRSVLDGCAVPNRAVDYFRDIIREAEITATSDPALAGQGLSAIISRCDEAIAALKGADAAPDHGPQRGRR